MSDYWQDHEARCRRSMDRAQAAYDAQQPPEYYEVIRECKECGATLKTDTCPECGEVNETDDEWTLEDYLADKADRELDER